MKKLFVVSDTHGNKSDLRRLLPKMQAADYVVHLGDGAADMAEFKEILCGKLISVSGNCDFFAAADCQIVLETEGVKILCCHGHKYQVKNRLSRLQEAAREVGAAAVFYGHTHRAAIDYENGIYCINPGALYRASRKSYCEVSISGGKIFAEIKYLN